MKAKRIRDLDPGASFADNAARIAPVRLAEMRSFAEPALDAGGTAAQHDLRIAAKRLRYVLEITGLCFGEEAAAGRRAARDLQDTLGELHDSDVMLALIADHVASLRTADARAVLERAGVADDIDPSLLAAAPNHAAYSGLELLAVHFEARRMLIFERFAELWHSLESDGVWERLGAATAAG